MFIKKAGLLLILWATTMSSYTQAKNFTDELKDQISNVKSIDDIANAIQWLTTELKNKPTLTVHGMGSKFSYESSFCEPIWKKIQDLKSHTHITDGEITEVLTQNLTDLIAAFEEGKQSGKYAEQYRNHFGQLNALKHKIAPTQFNSELAKKVQHALTEVNKVLGNINTLEQQKTSIQDKTRKQDLDFEKTLKDGYKQLTRSIDQLKILSDMRYQECVDLVEEIERIKARNKGMEMMLQ